MNYSIKIFGTPVTFDAYNIQAQELGYFQIFDDGSSEREKFKVHYRPGAKQVTYNYLRYNCLTQPGRPNAFFGISIVFQGEYCKNPMDIYSLFQFAYRELLKNGWILKEISSKDAQAQFSIQKFSDAGNECNNIITLLSNNINAQLASSILPLNIPTPQDASKVVCLAPQQADDNKILQALAACGTVSISPNYGNAHGNGEIAPGVIEAILLKYRELEDSFKEWSVEVDTFNQNFSVKRNLGTENELESEWQNHLSKGNGIADEIEKTDTVIASWLQKKRTHKQLIGAKKMVESLKLTCNQRVGNFGQYKQVFGSGRRSDDGSRPSNGSSISGDGGRPSGGGSISGDGGTEPFSDRFEKFIYHNKKLLSLILVGIIILVGVITAIALTKDDGGDQTAKTASQTDLPSASVNVETTPEDTYNKEQYLAEAKRELNNNNYPAAYQYYKLAGDTNGMAAAQVDYYKQCLQKATGHPDKEEWFKEEIKKVEKTPTEADLQKIRKTSNSTTKINTGGAKPDDNAGNGATNKAAKYSIQIYSPQNKEVQVQDLKKRTYTFKCYKDGKEDTGGTWYYNNTQTTNKISLKKGSNQIEYKVNGKTVQSISKTLSE